MPVELSQGERAFLENLLRRELEDIRMEIHHTKNHEYKDNLKEREILIRRLLDKVAAS